MPHRLLLLLLFLLLSMGVAASAAAVATRAIAAPPQAASQTDAREGGARLMFADGRLSFVPPPGFTPLTDEERAVKFPHANAPRRAVGNARRTTTIAYDLLDQRAPSEDLDAARKLLAETYDRALTNVKWIGNDVRRIAGRNWAYLEFTADASDQPIHNLVLLSVYDGRVLLFNFNSTTAEFPRVEQALRASMATIASAP